MKFSKIIIAILLLGLILSGCREKSDTRDSLSVWCLEDEPVLDELKILAEEYNSEISRGILPVSIRTFPDEESLATGFETLRPDILICAENKAQELSSLSLTKDLGHKLETVPQYRSYISRRIPRSGRDIFPIGGNVQLLCAKDGILNTAEGNELTLEYICREAQKYASETGFPFFTADSFAELFYQALLSEGKEFHALKELDIKNEEYKKIYNLLADSAYSGALISSPYSSAQLLKSSNLPCAFINSSELPDFNSEGFNIYMPFRSESVLSALSCFTISLRDGRDSESALAFLNWIFSEDRLLRLCLKSGLVPCTETSGYASSDSAEILLMKLGAAGKLHMPEEKSDFLSNYKDFELSCRDAFEFLG